jgi:hypothetical protein
MIGPDFSFANGAILLGKFLTRPRAAVGEIGQSRTRSVPEHLRVVAFARRIAA